MGEISLRRRLEPVLQVDVFEVKLGDEFLMSSLFTTGEEETARLGLGAIADDDRELDVIVGGLGLGYTARAALADPRVRSLHVIEALAEVIGWHRDHLVPLGAELTADARCRLVHGDFFEMVAGGIDLGPGEPAAFDAILVDIDHAPDWHLADAHAGFYSSVGLGRVVEQLNPGGVFSLWSDSAPDDAFVGLLRSAFASAEANVVTFPNFYTGGESASTVYVATAAG